MLDLINRLAMEPPFRIVARALLKRLPISSATRALWDLGTRPPYLVGLVAAAQQAKLQNVAEISAMEFGVAGGAGLIALQDDARSVERDTGVAIKVFGFDMGAAGLPEFIGDYRDHPDVRPLARSTQWSSISRTRVHRQNVRRARPR